MKFQYKALVAALALSAATVPAQAAMTMPTSGDSSLVLSLLDATNGISATFDLGYSYSSFASIVTAATNAGGTLSWDVTKGDYADAWTAFSSLASSTTTQWAVIAGDRAGSGNGAFGLISTINSDTTSTYTSGDLRTQLGNLQNYISSANTLSNHNSVNHGANTATVGNGSAYANSVYGAGKFANIGQDANAAYGQEMKVIQVTGNSLGSALVKTTVLGDANGAYKFTMSNAGVLSFSVTTPVPEADTYALLLAGLGVVGAVARRRKA